MNEENKASKYVGQRIELLRNEKGLTRENLGELIEMNPKAIGHIEKGEYSVDVDLIQRIVKPIGGRLDIVW